MTRSRVPRKRALLNGLLAAALMVAGVVVYRSLGRGSPAGATPITATA